MAKKRILLALSSSEYALNAAETAWSMADRLGAVVDASHIVDSVGAWRLLNFDRPGFMGSGVHIETHQKIVSSLRSLGSTLAEVYTARASSHPSHGQVFVDSGDPIEEICRRAADYDLVVVGHRPPSLRGSGEKSRSVAERLAMSCPVPLLVVQRKPGEWLTATTFTSMDHVDRNYLRGAVSFCRDLKLEPQIACFSTGIHEEMPVEFIQALRQADPVFRDIVINALQLGDTVPDGSICKWFGNELKLETSIIAGGLTVIPTHTYSDGRESLFGTRPDRYIDELGQAALLFWPEEFALTENDTAAA